MKTVLLRFAVHTLASLPSSCEQGQETEGQGASSCCRHRPSLPDRRRHLGVRRQAEPVADPTPWGAPGLAFPPSAVQLWILDSASWREEETEGRGGRDGTRKEREGREASLQEQRGKGPLREGGSPLRGAQGPPSAGASRIGSGSPPAGGAGEEGSRLLKTSSLLPQTPQALLPAHRPQEASESPLLRWSERRSSDPPGADLWLTPPPLGRFLPPGPVCTEHPHCPATTWEVPATGSHLH